MDKLKAKWWKAKQKATKATARELELRALLDKQLAAKGKDKEVFTLQGKKITLRRNYRRTIPKAAIPGIKQRLDREAFNKAFSTTYTLKATANNNLTEGVRRVLEDKVVAKYGTLQVQITGA